MDVFMHTKRSVQPLGKGDTNVVDVTTLQKDANDQTINRSVTKHEEVFTVHEVATLDDSQVVSLKLDCGNYIRFQIDSGAQCNVIPLALYQKATRGCSLTHVTHAQSTIVAYGGYEMPVVD